MEVGLGPGDVVLDGEPASPEKKARPHPIFGLCPLWPNRCMHQDATWYGGRPRPRPHCVRWGPSSPQKGDEAPTQFLVHFYCGQTAGCIKMPLGTEVGLGICDIVFDVDPATPRKSAHPPHAIFGPCLLWPKGRMHQDATWYGGRPRPKPHC